MSTYWEKQKRLQKLVKNFEESKKEYMGDDALVDFTQDSEYKRQLKERHSPSPPMSPFSGTSKN